MLGMGFGPGLFQNLSSLFLPGLEHDFGWTRGGIAAMTATALAAGIASPWIGRFADRHGARPLILASMLTLGAVLVALGAGSGAKWQFQALLVLLVLTMPGCSSLAYGKLIARAFVRHRGVALAVSTSGLAVATLFMPPIVGGVIAQFGWRAGFVAMAAATAAFALPLVMLALRRANDHRRRSIPTRSRRPRPPAAPPRARPGAIRNSGAWCWARCSSTSPPSGW
ncbi:MFS transporter [Sphingomonas sp. MMS24-JH45]